jgi:hypothetical protein
MVTVNITNFLHTTKTSDTLTSNYISVDNINSIIGITFMLSFMLCCFCCCRFCWECQKSSILI